MSEGEGTNRQQRYHEQLDDAKELLLLQDLVQLPIEVHPFFAIIWGAIEALVTDLADRVQVDIPTAHLELRGLRRGDEVLWEDLHRLVAHLAGRLHDDKLAAWLTDSDLADFDRRVASLRALREAYAHDDVARMRSALRMVRDDAREAAKELAATDPHDPSWGQLYEASGQLRTKLQVQSTGLTHALGDRASAESARRVDSNRRVDRAAARSRRRPAPLSRITRAPSAPGTIPNPRGREHRNPGSSPGGRPF